MARKPSENDPLKEHQKIEIYCLLWAILMCVSDVPKWQLLHNLSILFLGISIFTWLLLWLWESYHIDWARRIKEKFWE